MVARSDGSHYGRLFVFQFPKQKVVFGPRQIVARSNQDQLISQQITLWNQQGSQVLQGTLLVIPINESLLYVRPLYLRSQGGKMPELKRVIVAYQDQIVMADTLNKGLVQIFGRKVEHALSPDLREATVADLLPVTPATDLEAVPVATDLAALAKQANEIYARMDAALKAGDLTLFGEEYKKLGEVVAAMEKIKK
jgi:uncharacterized membrane protein (UPF0182 family)